MRWSENPDKPIALPDPLACFFSAKPFPADNQDWGDRA